MPAGAVAPLPAAVVAAAGDAEAARAGGAATPATADANPARNDGAAAAAPAAAGRISLDRRVVAVVAGTIGCVVIAAILSLVRHHTAEPSAAQAVPAASAPPPASPATASGAPPSMPGIVGSPAAPAVAGAPGAETSGGAATGPASARVEEARRLRHNGEWEQALAVLARARHESPQDADVDYLLADIYLEHHRPLEGLASAQSAIRKNPALRSDGDLINAVIESLASDKTFDRSEAFLRGLGSAATPFLKEAAHHHASAKVRQRAAEVLQGAGGGRSAFGSSSHSSSSLFRR